MWLTEYVKGHQEGGDLARQAELNNIADRLATTAQKRMPWDKGFKTPPMYLASKIAIMIENRMISRQINKAIIYSVTSRDIQKHMEKKF